MWWICDVEISQVFYLRLQIEILNDFSTEKCAHTLRDAFLID